MLLRYSPILLYLSRRDLSSADSEKSVETLFPREDGAEGGGRGSVEFRRSEWNFQRRKQRMPEVNGIRLKKIVFTAFITSQHLTASHGVPSYPAHPVSPCFSVSRPGFHFLLLRFFTGNPEGWKNPQKNPLRIWRSWAEKISGKMAAQQGFEPRQTEPESVVLPLHHWAVREGMPFPWQCQ